MVYAYIRVSTDKQTNDNQKYEIGRFCKANDLTINQWIEECISGKKSVQKRKLGSLLKRMKKDDILICSELSRLGRNLLMIMGILNECMQRQIKVWTIGTGGYSLRNSQFGKVRTVYRDSGLFFIKKYDKYWEKCQNGWNCLI